MKKLNNNMDVTVHTVTSGFKNLILFLLPVLFIAISCESGNDPVDDLEPGRRDYVWEVDTLETYDNGVVYSDIWGANPDDIWLVGSGFYGTKTILRYNGVDWRLFNNGEYYQLGSMYGTSENNIWFGGADGKMYHFNGSEFNLFQTIKENGYNSFNIQDIDGTMANNIIAVGTLDGNTGAVARFNGSEWKIEYVADFPSQFADIEMDPTRYNVGIVFSYLYESTDDAVLYDYNNRRIEEIHLGRFNANSVSIATPLGDELFLFEASILYKYQEGSKAIYVDLRQIGFGLSRIWGRNRKDFFFSDENKLYHFNGSDSQILYTTQTGDHIDIRGAVIFEEEVFLLILNHTNTQMYIFHGSLE